MPLPFIRQLPLYGMCAAFAAGCATSAPSPTPTPTAEPADSARVVEEAATWTPQRSQGSWRYKLESSAKVTLSGDTTANALPVERTAIYNVTLAPPNQGEGMMGSSTGSFQLTGHVDSVAVTTASRIPQPTAGTSVRPYFSAELTPGGHLVDIQSNTTTRCEQGVDPLTAAVQSLFVPLPAGLSMGSSWQDTLSIATCRGSTEIITTAVRHYRVTKDTVWQNSAVLLIASLDTSFIRSRPDSDSTNMKIDGTGNSAMSLYVDPHTGLLVRAHGESHTTLTVITAQSQLPFRQDATEIITLLR